MNQTGRGIALKRLPPEGFGITCRPITELIAESYGSVYIIGWGIFPIVLYSKCSKPLYKGVLQDREDKVPLAGATLKLVLLPHAVTRLAADTTRTDSTTTDSTKIADSAASLIAIPGDTITFNAVSNRAGTFEFTNLSPGIYVLTISSIGFEQMEQQVLLADSSKDLGTVQVSRQAKVLSEVVVKVSPPPVRQKADTLEYSANAFKVNPDANAEDIVKKMPGVTVDKGTVTAQGEQVRKVTIGGREFFGE